MTDENTATGAPGAPGAPGESKQLRSQLARRKRSAAALLTQGLIASVVMLGVGATAAWAAWTAQVTVPGGTVTAGTLDLQFADATGAAAGTDTPFAKTLSLPVTDLTPTESTAFMISPKNAGTAKFNYTVNASSTAAGVVSVQFFAGTAEAPAKPGVQKVTYPRTNTCSGTAVDPSIALSTTAVAAFTAPRGLAANASESLCVVVSVLSTAPPAAAGSSPSIIFNFTASQVTG